MTPDLIKAICLMLAVWIAMRCLSGSQHDD